MNEETCMKTWKAYQDAWADVTPVERERLLRQSVTEDVAFASPVAEGKGFAALLEHLGDFQKQYSGAYFKTSSIISHHGQFLAAWTMYNRDGSEFNSGHSHVRFNEQGLFTSLSGFFRL